MKETMDIIRQWIARQWAVCKPWILRQWEQFKPWVSHLWHLWTDRENRWLSMPCTAAALFVLLVLVKSCQGIVYNYSDECKIYKLGYPIEEARLLTTVLSDDQADSLIARGEHDTIAYPVINERYFIAKNFERYLAFHKNDTTSLSVSDIIAVVNVGGDREQTPVPCDTSKGYLMLVNGHHYLDEHYKPDALKTFKKTCCYEEQKAKRTVVEAFMKMQQECKEETGAQLMVNSAYRSHQDQKGTYKRNDKRYVATPGHSEHQTGLAIDVTSLQHPEKWSFDKSKEGEWMRKNCHEYGFILRYPEKQSHVLGFSYEPWHLRYVGVETATRIHQEDITFDEYYAFYLDKR